MCIALSACSSSGSFKIPEIAPDVPRIQFENMFLRGVFNWWEADPSYKFKRSNSGWTVDVELIADGQPYDFRLSDAKWTPSQSMSVVTTTRLPMGSNTAASSPTPRNVEGCWWLRSFVMRRMSPNSPKSLISVRSMRRRYATDRAGLTPKCRRPPPQNGGPNRPAGG